MQWPGGDESPFYRRGSVDVQRGIDLLGEPATDARHLRNLFAARTTQRRDTAEVSEQFAPPLRPDTGDALQLRLTTRLAAPRAMSGDREPMRLIADVLQQMHGTT